ncbi:hypothetical protein ACO0OL_001819 [Hanseniaspora opuntiae]
MSSEDKIDVYTSSEDKIQAESSDYTLPQEHTAKKTFFSSFIESFQRADENEFDEHNNGKSVKPTFSQLETSVSNQLVGNITNKNTLKRNIKPRHQFMISIGTGVGTGMLVSTGSALRQAGPANLELSGSYNDMFKFLIDPAFGFATNICYALDFLCVLPLELVTSSLLIRYWTTKVNADIFVSIFYVLLFMINLIGGNGYAEFEFIISSIKLTAVMSFLIYGLIKDLGGTPNQKYIGGKYWREPGAFRGDDGINRFKGLCVCFVFAAFAYGGFESSILVSSVVEKPVQALKKGRKMLLYRIFIVYLGLLLIIGLLVPFNNPKLLGGSGSESDASPLIIAVSNVNVYPHILNAVILLSVLSVANNALYTSARTLHSLFTQFCPHPNLTYVDKRGRPLACMAVSAVFGLLCLFAAASFRVTFFNWLLSISGLAALFTYGGMNIAHIRFRKALKAQGKSLNELAFISPTGVWGSYWSVIMIGLIFIAQFWVALVPIGSSKPDANNFFQNYLCAIVWLICYIGYKIYNKEWQILIPVDKIDIDSNRIIYDHEVIKLEEQEKKIKLKNSSIFKRILSFWC